MCIIRVDIAHLIKLVCRWPCFTHAPATVKDFFVRCIGVLSKCTTINNFANLCTDVLTVSFSNLEDIENNNNLCFSAQLRLLKIIKTDTEIYNATESDLLITFTDSEDDTNMSRYSEIDIFLQNIEKESKKGDSGTRPNPYYCPDFGKRLVKLCKYFLLWTAVLSTTDKNLVATSARSEEYFREVKDLIFNGNKSNRIDKFVILHLRSLAGTMKLLNAPNNLPSQHKSKPDHKNQASNEKERSHDNSTDIDDNVNMYDNGDCSLDYESNKNLKVLETSNDNNNLNISDVSHDAVMTHVDILNEMESWRGKNKIKK
ncbi:120.7 kDa protein in NOF-FB transposable element [Formica fusca]